MRTALQILVLAGACLASAAALGTPPTNSPNPTSTESRTVMATYYVVAGKEAEFEQVLAKKWETYTKEKLVFDSPHIIVRGKEADGKVYFVHIFTWVSPDTTDHPPASVLAVWQSIDSLIEARNGHPSREVADVQLVTPNN